MLECHFSTWPILILQYCFYTFWTLRKGKSKQFWAILTFEIRPSQAVTILAWNDSIKTINFNHSAILLCSCPNCPKLLPKSCPLLLWRRRPKTFLRSFRTNKSTLLWRQLKLVTISSAIWDGVVRSTVQRRLDSEKDLSSCNILLDGGGVTVTWNCRKLLPTPAPCFGSSWAASKPI